jgi:flap endonuclease GEN
LETPKGPRPSGVQLSITEFYRSKKGLSIESGKKSTEEGQAAKEGSRKASDRDLNKSLPKSVRRRLLFD